MITEIQVENVRLFSGSGWTFPIHPLEVICGTNSAGKSTLLKLLLLLRQSALLPENRRESEGRLRFISDQTDLGNYLSFVSNNDGTKDITIRVTIRDTMSESRIRLFKAIHDESLLESKKSSSKRLPYTLKSSFTFGLERKPVKRSDEKSEEQTGELSAPGSQGFLKRADFEIVHAEESLLSWAIVSSLASSTREKTVGRYELLIPQAFSQLAMAQMEGLGKDDKTQLERFQVTMSGILPDGLRAKWVKNKKRSIRGNETFYWPLPPQIDTVLQDFLAALQNIHYLGPLRTPAKRYYVTSFDETPDLDSTGEFLPSILHQKGHAHVFGIPRADELSTLESGLNIWLHFLRTGEKLGQVDSRKEIELSTTKDVLVELLLKTPSGNNNYALADSGFGYSQVLPILVRGLLARPGSTLIIEQPELHLNPALQVRLASFFIELTKAGKQVLIETHSEHIVNAIRVLAAEDESNTVAKQLGIIFIEMGTHQPVVRHLDIHTDGTLAEWPNSFFGDALDLASRLLKAQARAKRSE